jgi:hypothetical protein
MGVMNSRCDSQVSSPIFLKAASHWHDVNARGAFQKFLICKVDSECGFEESTMCLQAKNLLLYKHSEKGSGWAPYNKKLWAALGTYAKQHAEWTQDEVDFDNTNMCAPYVFDAEKAHEHRSNLKKETEDQNVMLVSLVANEASIDGWLQNQMSQSTKNTKVVKVTEKSVKSSSGTVNTYTRMFARAGANGMINTTQSEVGVQICLMEVIIGDLICAITNSNVIMLHTADLSIKECVFGKSRTQYDELCELVKTCERTGGSDAFAMVKEKLNEICTKESQLENASDHNNRFVVLLSDQKGGTTRCSVQCLHSLKGEMQDKIETNAAATPPTVSHGHRVCDTRGSMFKRASRVFLSVGSFSSSGDHTICFARYE